MDEFETRMKLKEIEALERIAKVLEEIKREGLSMRVNTDSWYRK